MNQRWLTLRILAPVLALVWVVLGASLVFLHAGVEGAGPLVAAWPFLPAAIAVAGVFRSRTGQPPAVAHLLIGVGAVLLAISFAITLVEPSGMPDRALYSASPMVALGGGLAASVTALFAITGRQRAGSRSGRALTVGLAAGLAAGGALMLPGAGIATAACDSPPGPGPGRSEVVAEGWVDEERLAYEIITSAPNGSTSADAQAALVALLGEITDPAVEDRGIDVLGGTPLRHCRRLVSGSQALRGFESLALVMGRAPEDAAAALGVWRGELDWWSNEQGHLVAARVSVGGLASDLFPGQGLRGLLRAELRVPAGGTARLADEALP
jgi:NADH:ubiquinone oxidoreductase subunit 6 (subunit J)